GGARTPPLPPGPGAPGTAAPIGATDTPARPRINIASASARGTPRYVRRPAMAMTTLVARSVRTPTGATALQTAAAARAASANTVTAGHGRVAGPSNP